MQVVEANAVHIRPVRSGLSGQGRIELLDGVKEGDIVVARAGTFLREGDIITPVPQAVPAASPAQARASGVN